MYTNIRFSLLFMLGRVEKNCKRSDTEADYANYYASYVCLCVCVCSLKPSHRPLSVYSIRTCMRCYPRRFRIWVDICELRSFKENERRGKW